VSKFIHIPRSTNTVLFTDYLEVPVLVAKQFD
jgi:hypothetical protein